MGRLDYSTVLNTAIEISKKAGEKIREIFLEETNEIVDPITEAFLLYASRKHLDQNILRTNLEKGCIVIADRYADATLAY